jgi:hypothetical protein
MGWIKSLGKGTKMLKLARKELSVSLLAMTALVLPVSAHAVELNTSPIWADSGSSYHACNVANVTTSSELLKVTMLNSSGVAIASSGTADITLAAGAVYELSQSTYTGFAYCRFNLGSAAGGTVRANSTVFHFTGVYYETLAFSEAR